MQLVRVTCIFTGHYNTDLHVAFTDVILNNPAIFSGPDKYNTSNTSKKKGLLYGCFTYLMTKSISFFVFAKNWTHVGINLLTWLLSIALFLRGILSFFSCYVSSKNKNKLRVSGNMRPRNSLRES